MSAETAALWVAHWEGTKVVSDPWLSCCGVSIHYNPEFTADEIRAMTPEKAAPVFVKKCWPARADELPDYLSIPFMAFAVVEGPTQAVYALQRALGVAVDGGIGPQTLSAAAATTEKRDEFLIDFFRACRKRFAESSRWLIDGAGWEARQFAASLAAKVWAP